MNIHDAWWFIPCMITALLIAIGCVTFADKGGRNCVDFGDPLMGCIFPVIVILLGIIASLVLWVSGITLIIGR